MTPIFTGMGIGLAATLLIFGSLYASVLVDERRVRRRTQSIRERDIPPFESWRRLHYPKASKDEPEIIKIVLNELGGFAYVESTQLRPDDPLENFVFGVRLRGIAWLDQEDDWALLLEGLVYKIGWHQPQLAPWEVEVDRSLETVGDVIDFLLKRISFKNDETIWQSRRSGLA